MRAFFVTATGTEIGKTLVCAALVHQLTARGKKVRVIKPLVTGWGETPPTDSDPGVLLESLDQPCTPDNIAALSPWRYGAPLAPNMAAAKEGKTVPVAEVIAFCRKAARGRHDILLVEGVGGVMVPLVERITVRDLMAELGFPAVLVAGSYLGTLSHTLTALEALTAGDIALAGIVVSETAASAVGLADTVAALRPFADPRPVIALPRLAGEKPWRRAADLTRLLD